MIMNWKIFKTEHDGLTFKIEEDFPEVGVYLYVYEKEKCIKDFLQNTILDCKQVAFEKYRVPMDKWEEVKN